MYVGLGVPTMVATYELRFSTVSDIFILIPVTRINCKILFAYNICYVLIII